jgi:hypothetical protein
VKSYELGELLEFVGALRREDCMRFEARRFRDGEGAFFVRTCFLVTQESSILSGCPRYHGKRSGCLVSLSFTFKRLFFVLLVFMFAYLLIE